MAMALHLPTMGCAPTQPCASNKNGTNGAAVVVVVRAHNDRMHPAGVFAVKEQQPWRTTGGAAVRCRSAAETGSASTVDVAAMATGGVTEVDKDTFWPLVKEAGEEKKLVVLDMYTQWCGPCKLMLPKVIKLSESYSDVVFAKLDCNQENKALAKELGVKTVPTFKIFRDAEEVAEVRGAKYDDLVAAIEKARSSS